MSYAIAQSHSFTFPKLLGGFFCIVLKRSGTPIGNDFSGKRFVLPSSSSSMFFCQVLAHFNKFSFSEKKFKVVYLTLKIMSLIEMSSCPDFNYYTQKETA